jgi:hypothetical protein
VIERVQHDGSEHVVGWCVDVLAGRDVAGDFLRTIGGDHAVAILSGREGGVDGYWPRVWALRALQYVWLDEAYSSVATALDDAHWRVRAMAARVVGYQKLADLTPRLVHLTDDEIARVRISAEQALRRLSSG